MNKGGLKSMKSKILKKLCSGLLALSMLTSPGIGQSVGELVGSGITVNAADTLTCGDYEYTVNSDNTITIKKYTGSGTEIMIPSSIDGKKVTSIGEMAFSYCKSLTSITIPNSVVSIEHAAFYYCHGLTSITIPNSVTSIGDESFFNCTELTSIAIPNSVITIGDSAFKYCQNLKSVNIPDSVTTIGFWAFSYCTSLENISVSAGNSVYSSKDGILFNKKGTEIVSFPCAKTIKYVIPDGVISIGSHAFSGCSGLAGITIPNSVTSIGVWVFEDCSNLTSITIPDSVTSIGNGTFYGCSGLTSITIPNSVTFIGSSVFNYCKNLKSITIPNGVTSIGYGVFSNCTNLTSITIPNSVISIGGSAFAYCHSLKSITIPNSVTSIGGSAFEHCNSLKSITIPDSVTSIGSRAFRDCTVLTSINIPNGVTEIGNYAFYGCYDLTIYGNKGSYAETYAKNNNIPFVEKTVVRTVSFDTKGGNTLNSIDLTNASKYGTLPVPQKRGYIFKDWSLNETTENKSLFEKDTDIYFQIPDCWRYNDDMIYYDSLIIYCHLWNTETDSSEKEPCIYPWKDEKEICTYVGNNIYKYTIPAGSDVNGVIFASNQFDQTNDISIGTVCANDMLIIPEPDNPIVSYTSSYGSADGYQDIILVGTGNNAGSVPTSITLYTGTGYWYEAEWTVNKEYKSMICDTTFMTLSDTNTAKNYNNYWLDKQDRIIDKPKNVKIKGYKFVDANTDIPLPISHNLYAVWENADLYYLSYNMNGGNGSIDSQDVYSNEKAIITNYQPTRTDYTFLGWSKQPDSVTAQYKAGNEISLSSNHYPQLKHKRIEYNS